MTEQEAKDISDSQVKLVSIRPKDIIKALRREFQLPCDVEGISATINESGHVSIVVRSDGFEPAYPPGCQYDHVGYSVFPEYQRESLTSNKVIDRLEEMVGWSMYAKHGNAEKTGKYIDPEQSQGAYEAWTRVLDYLRAEPAEVASK